MLRFRNKKVGALRHSSLSRCWTVSSQTGYAAVRLKLLQGFRVLSSIDSVLNNISLSRIFKHFYFFWAQMS